MTTHRKAPDTMSGFDLLALACSVGLVPLNSTMIAVALLDIEREVEFIQSYKDAA